jgi:acyl carrier protein
MTRDEVSTKVIASIAETLELDPSEIKESDRFVEDLNADSLDILELVVSLRDNFDVTVKDGEVKGLLVELARFLNIDDGSEALTEESSDEEVALVAMRLTVKAIVDFVYERVSATAP